MTFNQAKERNASLEGDGQKTFQKFQPFEAEKTLPKVYPLTAFQRANLGGFPAISFPVGYDAKGLPVGMQLMGRPWEESFLLRMAKISENYFVRHPPMMRFSLLPD